MTIRKSVLELWSCSNCIYMTKARFYRAGMLYCLRMPMSCNGWPFSCIMLKK